jgi:hypothetical protein
MSELGFTGKIPIPNLKQVGDLSGEVSRQQQLQMRSGALAAKQQAARTKALQDQMANQAELKSQLGGLYENVHPFALPFVEQAAAQLEQDVMKLLPLANGAELAKPMIADFKASVSPYELNAEMMKSRNRLAAMTDKTSEAYRAENKELGNLYLPVATEDMVFAADNHQNRDLLRNAKLDYNNGRFKIEGQAFDRRTGQVADEVTELSVSPFFNDPAEYQYGTTRANVMSLRMIGEGIKAEDKSAAANSGWDAERVTGKYANLYENYVDFDAMAETDNDEYAFRLASYFRTRQDIIDRNPTAASFKNEEQLLEYYELDPRKRESGDTALYDLVKGAIKDSWTTGTLPHTKWEIKDTKSAGKIKIDVLSNAVPATLTGAPINLVTGGEYDLVFDESMVEGTGDNRKKKFNTVVYAIQEIPSTQSETVKVTSVNPKYYDKMALFMAYRNREGKRFADRTPDGRIAIMTPDPPPADATPTERREYDEALQRSLALTKVMNDEDFYVEEEVDGYRVYENNPTKYVLQLTNAAEVFIDMANLNDPLSQMIHSSVLTALDKGQLSPQDLWDDAVTKFGTRPSFPTELPGSR